MTVTSLPFASSTLSPRASANLRPSWKMWPISMPRASSNGPEPSGAGSPARTSAASIGAVRGEVASADQVEDVLAVDVGSGDPAGALDHPRVDQEADGAGRIRAQGLRSDIALDQHRVARSRRRRTARPRPAPVARPGASGPPRGPPAPRRRAARRTRPARSPSARRSSTCPRPSTARSSPREPLVGHRHQRGDGRGVRGVLDVGRAGRRRSRSDPGPASAPPRRWPHTRPGSGRRCPRRSRRWPGTPR